MSDKHRVRVLTCFGIFFVAVTALLACGRGKGDKALLSRLETLAELRTVKRGVVVVPPGEGPRAPYPRERLVDGETVRLEAGALAWLRRDGGATLLVSGPAELVVRASSIEMKSGRIFVDTRASEPLALGTPRGALHLADVRASVEAASTGPVGAYVLAGGVQTEGGVVARPGELLSLESGGKATRTPQKVWDDWTGGLATADPAAAQAPFGIGTVGARPPGSVGEARFPLSIQRLDVKVHVDGDFVTTEVDEVFFNPTSDTVEGIFRFRTPAGAVLERFGVDRDGELVWGRLKEKEAAAAQYQSHVYQGSTEDPALLEWDAPGVYKARLYPIGPGETRRVVTRYGEWLSRHGARGERRLYVYPMAAEGAAASLPRIEELTVDFDLTKARATEVRVGMRGVQNGKRVVVKGFDVVPKADLALEMFDGGGAGLTAYRAPHRVDVDTTAKDKLPQAQKDARGEVDYLLVPVRPGQSKDLEGGLDVALVVDGSAAIEAGALAIARTMATALLAHLGPKDRVAVWAGDASLRPVAEGSDQLVVADAARRERIAQGLSQIERGGATDLGALIAEAATRLEDGRRGVIVYLGDGMPTVGELAPKDLRARLDKLPRPVRLFGIGIGDQANLGLLKGIARGGFAERVTDGFGAAECALRVLEAAERPVWLGATVDLGPGVDRVFPRELPALSADETALVVGRVVGPLPKEVRLKASTGESTTALSVAAIMDGGDLKRRWAEGRLEQLLEEGAGRPALVEIGTRFGVLTPVTSFYVPTADEYRAEQGKAVAMHEEDDDRDEKPWWRWPWVPNVLSRSSPEAASAYAPQEEEMAANKEGGTGTRAKGEEGSMGRPPPAPPAQAAAPAAKSASRKRYAVAGPKDNGVNPDKALEQAQELGVTGLQDSEAAGDAPASPAPVAAATAQGEASPVEAAPEITSPTGDGAVGLGLSGIGRGGGAIRPAATGGGLGSIGSTGRAGQDEQTLRSAVQAAPAASAAPPPDAFDGTQSPNEANLAGPGGLGTGPGFGSGHGRLGGSHRTGTSTTVDVRVRIDHGQGRPLGLIGHAPRPCPSSADLPFEERRALWRERLARADANAHAVLTVYRNALARCEVPTFRERAALLVLMVDRLPSIRERVVLYRSLLGTSAAADVVYRAILTRVDTAAEIRELHDALGIRRIAPEWLEKLLRESPTLDARIQVLRGLVKEWPDDLELSLRLLEALEDTGNEAEGRSLGRALRKRSDATTHVRTAVGEYYLRLARRGKGPAADRDTVEARRTFGEIVEFSPEDPGARRRLGDLLRTHGWYEEALRQYETLARLTPDDTSTQLLLAAAANGLGRVEEAVRWTEKASGGTSDETNPLSRTSRALASAFLAWARSDALKGGRTEEAERLRERARRLGGAQTPGTGNVRILLTWAHPEFHPDLWSNPLGAPMPAPDGNPLLGVAETVLPTAKPDGMIELRLEPADLAQAMRLGAQATLTAIVDEGEPTERIERTVVAYGKEPGASAAIRRFKVEAGSLKEVVQ